MKTITPSEARDIAVKIIADRGDQLNPVDGGGNCMYSDPEDPTKHCIIGQFMVDTFGFCPTPEDDENYSYNADQLFGWSTSRYARLISDEGFEVPIETQQFLQSLQYRADEATHDGRPWSTIEIPNITRPTQEAS